MVSLLMVFGSIALIGGGAGYFGFPMAVKMGVQQIINLKEDGMVFPLFSDPPFGTISEYRIYAIKNPREFLKGGKMSLELKGPYAFNTRLTKEAVNFSMGGQKVQYDGRRRLSIQEQKSANFDERMWLLNPIFPGIQKSIRAMAIDRIPFQRISEPIVFNAVNVLLDRFKERLITRTTPRILMQGRTIELLVFLTQLAGRFNLQTLIPPGPPQNVFGLAYVQNETIDKIQVWTGISPSVEKFADVSAWNEKTKMNMWDGRCNIISGTNGELYKPFLEEGKPIRIFLSQLCRTFYLVPTGDGLVTLDSGIKAYEFEMSPKLWMGVRSNPSNRCFCEDAKTYECQYDGLVTMGPCFFNSPLYFAKGNFKGLNPRISDLIDTEVMKTNKTADKNSFYLDPITGTVLQVNITLMAVFKVAKQPYMRDLAKVQNLTYAPLFTTTEQITLPYDYIWQIHLVQMLLDYHKPAMIGTGLSGVGMTMAGYFMK